MTETETHILAYGDDLHYVLNRTLCGKRVRRQEISKDESKATCPRCKQKEEEYNKLDV